MTATADELQIAKMEAAAIERFKRKIDRLQKQVSLAATEQAAEAIRAQIAVLRRQVLDLKK